MCYPQHFHSVTLVFLSLNLHFGFWQPQMTETQGMCPVYPFPWLRPCIHVYVFIFSIFMIISWIHLNQLNMVFLYLVLNDNNLIVSSIFYFIAIKVTCIGFFYNTESPTAAKLVLHCYLLLFIFCVINEPRMFWVIPMLAFLSLFSIFKIRWATCLVFKKTQLCWRKGLFARIICFSRGKCW